jgi:hypothetical protein
LEISTTTLKIDKTQNSNNDPQIASNYSLSEDLVLLKFYLENPSSIPWKAFDGRKKLKNRTTSSRRSRWLKCLKNISDDFLTLKTFHQQTGLDGQINFNRKGKTPEISLKTEEGVLSLEQIKSKILS